MTLLVCFLKVNKARLKTGNRFLLHRHISINRVESKVNKTIGIIANSKMFFHDQHFLQFTSHSLGLT